jgi:hypothetical protein
MSTSRIFDFVPLIYQKSRRYHNDGILVLHPDVKHEPD